MTVFLDAVKMHKCAVTFFFEMEIKKLSRKYQNFARQQKMKVINVFGKTTSLTHEDTT